MEIGENDLGTHVRRAAADERGSEARETLCDGLATAFESAGELLWVCGWTLGPDRVSGDSPFQHGNDAVVGLATVLQIAGELTQGASQLLAADNLYAAAALIRQTVEVEYLAWAFSEAEDEAAAWLRSTREERHALWKPAKLRQRSNGRFRNTDYALHCDTGGHPTPQAAQLLRNHSNRQPLGFWWCDLVGHALNIWGYAKSASERLDVQDVALAKTDADRIDQLVREWEQVDPLARIVRQRRSDPNDAWGRILEAAREAKRNGR